MSKALKISLALVLVLIVTEVTLRIVDAKSNDTKVSLDEGDWYRFSGDLGWTLKANYSGDVYGMPRQFDGDGFLSSDTEQLKSGTKPRIMIIGGSTAFGSGVRSDSVYAEILDNMLPDYDVINLSVPGYSSYQGLQTLRAQIESIKPAIVIASFNMNDRRFVLDAQDQDGKEKFKQLADENSPLSRIMDSVAIVRHLKRLGGGSDDENELFDVLKLLPRVSPSDYKTNHVEMAFTARKHGARIIFLSAADNPIVTSPLYAGIDFYRDGDLQEAGKIFAVVAASPTAYTIVAQRFLVNLLKQSGQIAEAQRFGLVANPDPSFQGGHPVFLDADYSKFLLETARTESVTLINVGDPLRKDSKHFIDFMHFSALGHQAVAEIIAAEISKDQ